MIGDQVFDEDGVDLDRALDDLARGIRVTTAAPAPGRFADVYGALVAGGAEQILSLHVDGRVSAVVDAARLGAAEAGAAVRVVDTGQASFGVGACVLGAAEAIGEGLSVHEAATRACARAEGLGNVFVVGSGAGGRLGAEAAPGTVLSFAAGAPQPLARAPDTGTAIAAMVRRVAGEPSPLAVAVGYAHPDLCRAADRLAAELRALPDVVVEHRYRVGVSVAAHTGPWTFGAFFWRP